MRHKPLMRQFLHSTGKRKGKKAREGTTAGQPEMSSLIKSDKELHAGLYYTQ